MNEKAESIVLTEPARACLEALRDGKSTESIAIESGIMIKTAAAALAGLAELGLAEQNAAGKWLATALGGTCEYVAPKDEPADAPTSADGERLLALLTRPMRGMDIARDLGLTARAARQLLNLMNARQRVVLGDLNDSFWLVKRIDDPTPLLSRAEERMLSVLPRDHAANANALRAASRLKPAEIAPTLERLLASGLAEAFDALRGGLVYRVTEAGTAHPQCARSPTPAPPPRLPVQSDRIRNVLRAIADAGALRIKDIATAVGLPQQSANALMQYLKGRRMVATVADEPRSPYGLTEFGRATLAEMTLRRVA